MTTRSIDVGEVRLQVALAGPEGGRLVLLLHGFPECKETWASVQQSLAKAGFYVAAPDLRGYGGSDRPDGVESYAVEKLVGDVAGLIAALGRSRALVIGHDWGGVVAWWTAMLRPDVVERLGIVNAPHPEGYAAALHTPEQARRSWYVFFFQTPLVPEVALRAHDFHMVRGFIEPDGIAREEIDRCVDALRPPGAVEAAIAYYRAEVRDSVVGTAPKAAVITAPVMVVWGMKDRFLVPSLSQPPAEWVPNVEVVRLENASHWTPIDSADAVAQSFERFFT
ncbi:MAG: alpha/beta fold hydrolase [Polyangiaceae bacterium]